MIPVLSRGITMTFPATTNIGGATVIERSGIGAGGLSASGTTLTYTVGAPISVPAGTAIRLEIANLIQPNSANTFSIPITTAVGSGTATSQLTTIGTAAIANGAVTSVKIANGAVIEAKLGSGSVTSPAISPSLMEHVSLHDDSIGNAHGWNPNGLNSTRTVFQIVDPHSSIFSVVLISLKTTSSGGPVCGQTFAFSGGFEVSCTSAPAHGTGLDYVLTNLNLTPPSGSPPNAVPTPVTR
jgi:hypothetical protein